MLISCPKCHSIYEIPDDLIGRTGKNFRCQACSNIWHAMPEDAIGYMSKTEDNTPYIEALPVTEPPYRHFPSNQEKYSIPLDTKSGQRTRSSKELLKDEGKKTPIKHEKKEKEITLTSEQGTSFTISALPEADETETKTPHFYEKDEGIHATKEDMLRPQKSFRGYKKTSVSLFLLFILVMTVLLRRDIVSLYPQAEVWYNKILLSGLNNPEYLKFENIETIKQIEDNKPVLKLKATITNTSRYGTYVPKITISADKNTYKTKADFLKAKERTELEVSLPIKEENSSINFVLGFKRP